MLTAGRGGQVAGGLVEKDPNGPGVASFRRHELMNFAQENRSIAVVCMMNFLAESTTTVINKALVAALWAPDLGAMSHPDTSFSTSSRARISLGGSLAFKANHKK